MPTEPTNERGQPTRGPGSHDVPRKTGTARYRTRAHGDPFQHDVIFRLRGFVPALPKEQYNALPLEQQARKRHGSLELGKLNIAPKDLPWVLVQVRSHFPSWSDVLLLSFSGNPLSDDGLRLLIESNLLDYFAGTVHLGGCGITAAGAKMLADATHIRSLTGLVLSANPVGDEGVRAIAGAPQFATLTSLTVGNCGIGPEGVASIAGAGALATVKQLYLSGNEIGDMGAQFLANGRFPSALESLNVAGNRLTHIGAEYLAAAPRFQKLRSLSIGGNQIRDAGVHALTRPGRMQSLQNIDLRNNFITDHGVAAIERAEHWKLSALDLSGNAIQGAQTIVDLIKALKLRKPEELSIAVEGNLLSWADRPPVSPAMLHREHDPEKLMSLLLEAREKGVEFSFVRAVMAGTCGSGKTHLSKRFASLDDERLNRPLDEVERATKGVERRWAKVEPLRLNAKGLPPRVWLMVQDVGGHNEQIKCHYHLAYLAGDSLFLLCINMCEPIDRWPRYYLHLLADLGRRAFNGRTGIPRPMNDIPELEPAHKLKVLIVPTHCDRIGDPSLQSEIVQNVKDLCLSAAVQKTLDITVLACVSSLDARKVGGALRRVTLAVKDLPYGGSLELPYVEPILVEIEQALQKPGPLKCAFTHEELKAIFVKHGNVDFDYMVRAILRTGLLVTPLDEMPLKENEVAQKVGLLLNPAFVNAFIYGTLIYGTRSNAWGFVKTNEMHADMQPAKRDEQNAILRALESHKVIIPCKSHDGTEGYLVPDRFDVRPAGRFLPRSNSSVRRVWKAENFIPEHALFELMAYYRRLLEPIERQGTEIKTYAYRNACLYKDGGAEVQVYLNVLTRKLWMCGSGEGAEALMTHLFTTIDHDRVHGWNEVEKPWRSTLARQKEAVEQFEAIVAQASSAEDEQERITTRERHRSDLAKMIRSLKDHDGSLAIKTDEEFSDAIAASLSKIGKVKSHVTNLRVALLRAGLIRKRESSDRKDVYELDNLGSVLWPLLQETDVPTPNQMPPFDPDVDVQADASELQ